MIGFVSPSQFGHSNPLGYAVFILTGVLAICILPPLLLDRPQAGVEGRRR